LLAPGARGEESERALLSDYCADLEPGNRHRAAFLHAEGSEARRAQGRRMAGHGGGCRLDPDVIGARRSTADADAAAAPREAAVRRAVRDREIEAEGGQAPERRSF